MSQVEVGISLVGTALLEAAVTGAALRRPDIPGHNRSVGVDGSVVGYRGDAAAPSNVFRTRGGGHNDYCAVSVANDTQWDGLKQALGRPDWAEDERFATGAGRARHQDELERHIGEWMAQREKYEAMRILQDHGVPAGAVQSGRDRVDHDPQLRERGTFTSLEHPHLGTQLFEAVPFKSSASTYPLEPHWPVLGSDTEYVLGELLGYSKERIAELHEDNVLWPEGLAANPVVERSLW